jgi:hypothetical protein
MPAPSGIVAMAVAPKPKSDSKSACFFIVEYGWSLSVECKYRVKRLTNIPVVLW